MDKAVIIINEPPSSMRAWNGFRLAAALVGAEMKPEVFLINDGVFCAIKGQNTPPELAGQNTSHKIEELMGIGATIRVCTQCAQTRGLTEEDIAEGVDWVSMVDLAKSIRDCAKVISF